jgi:alpha-galactosidase
LTWWSADTARGSGTCQSRPGSLNHEYIDAATYCDWNIDYIKIDGCQGAQDPNTSWTRFHEGIENCYNETGHQVVMSVESCGDPSGCGQWIGKLANLWRTSGDIQNTCVVRTAGPAWRAAAR